MNVPITFVIINLLTHESLLTDRRSALAVFIGVFIAAFIAVFIAVIIAVFIET
jgi:hypothetical protein